MSSNRQPRQSGGAGPHHSKPAMITVEEWERKASLNELEARSVHFVKSASGGGGARLPPQAQFMPDERTPPRPSTPLVRAGVSKPNSVPASSSSRPTTPAPTHRHALHPPAPVHTAQQFYDWFALVERALAHGQEAHFRAHLARVSAHLDTCAALVHAVDVVDGKVNGMLGEWEAVERGGKNLEDACEKLLREREDLLDVTEGIGARLDYFQELEHAIRMLNHPGETLVLRTDFLYMVEKVEICIDHLKAHRHYRETEVYLLRYQQCMTRAMTLMKMYCVGSLRALTADISKRLSEKDVSTTAQMHLLYTRFRTISSQLAPLLAELERRARAHPDELSALLSECQAAYFSARKTLLVPRLTQEIKGLDPARTDLVELTRSGCSYLKQLCADEFDLYKHFFSSGKDHLYGYLESLCDHLYDDLRPRILHEPRLTVLCEVCTVLQALMVLDVSALPDLEDEDDEDGATAASDELAAGSGSARDNLGRLHISRLLQMVLQDAQTRLFFKAQSIIESDIKYHVPKLEDLAYPEKLTAADQLPIGLEVREKESVSQLLKSTSSHNPETLFPTLRKTIWVLGQLHNFVKPAVFEDIAQESLSLCLQSLVAASGVIKTRNSPASILDGRLFLIRHLMILKEVANTLDLAKGETEQFSDTAGSAGGFTMVSNETGYLLPRALFASLGMARDDGTVSHTRQSIDHELRNACEELISQCAESVCRHLSPWVNQKQVHRTAQNTTQPIQPLPADVVAPSPLTGKSAEEAHRIFGLACDEDLRSSVLRLRMYLGDNEMVSVLLTHIQERIVACYSVFWQTAVGRHGVESRDLLLTPTALMNRLTTICTEK